MLLGTAKPACIRFIVVKISSIMPAFYMWMLVYRSVNILFSFNLVNDKVYDERDECSKILSAVPLFKLFF